jgi:hypothetical protein
MTDLDRLRVEFPKADLLYVRRAAPAAIKLAERYNANRAQPAWGCKPRKRL